MKLNNVALLVPAVAAMALTVSVIPALAGQRGQRSDRQSTQQESRPSGSAQARQRAAPSAPAPQVQSQRVPQQGARFQGGSGVAPGRQGGYRQGAGGGQTRYVAPGSYGNSRGYPYGGGARSYAPSYQHYPSYPSYRVYPAYPGGRYYAGPVYAPYYAFRPHFSLGFGLYLGYPVAFPTWYNPYLPGVYPAYRPGVAYGGVSFDIAPYDASVYVDGNYVGVVENFSSTQPPLTLPAGRHHIEIDARGFQPMSFDLTVVPRQVIPYQGTLPRY